MYLIFRRKNRLFYISIFCWSPRKDMQNDCLFARKIAIIFFAFEMPRISAIIIFLENKLNARTLCVRSSNHLINSMFQFLYKFPFCELNRKPSCCSAYVPQQYHCYCVFRISFSCTKFIHRMSSTDISRKLIVQHALWFALHFPLNF